MGLELSPSVRKDLMASIQGHFSEELGLDIGDLKATLVLDFILKEIGPAIYNSAVADVQQHLQEVVSELDGTVFQPEPHSKRPYPD